ncbi:MAG: hypothetical protein R2876_04870 [Eubacteriales bacterium]
MPDYKKMYFELFNTITAIINQLQNAQRDGENTYMADNNSSSKILPNRIDEKLKSSE